MTKREFSKTMKLFFANKVAKKFATLYLEVIMRRKQMTNAWQNILMSIIELSKKSEKLVCHKEDFDKKIVLSNIKNYENHSSIIEIKNNMSLKSRLSSNQTLP